MLSENALVKAKKALESLYTGTCTITGKEEYTKANGSTGFRPVTLCEDEPCRISYQTVTGNTAGEAVDGVTQVIKLFISKEVSVPEGCTITASDGEVYTRSGKPANHDVHQEIVLELKDVRA